jgi:hypothetical protein
LVIPKLAFADRDDLIERGGGVTGSLDYMA